MELEILNYKIINVVLNKRKMRNTPSFDFSGSQSIKIYLEVKEATLSGKTGDVIIRLDGPKEVVKMINSGQITFDKSIYGEDNLHRSIDKLIDLYELYKYKKTSKDMDMVELLQNNLVDLH